MNDKLEELNIILSALNNVDRLQILLILSMNKEKSLKQIVEETSKGYNMISNHLYKLKLPKLVTNRVIKKKGLTKSERNLYKITDFGNHMIKSLLIGYNDYYLDGKKIKNNGLKGYITTLLKE